MKLKIGQLVVLLILNISTFAQQVAKPKSWTDKQVSAWFVKGNWQQKTGLKPDASINKKEFAVRYFKNKALWDKAFKFLRDSDLTRLKLGVHELQGKELFVKVTDYKTKDPAAADFETHTAYTDIHTVVSGGEYIQLAGQEGAVVKIPYNTEKDITFYTVPKSRDLLSTPGKFFLIFPDDLHKQGVKVDTTQMVRKIVIKVKN
jgi:YhcH/YjgK/YiaL family protein